MKQYAELAAIIGEAVARYAADVRTGAFPEDEHTYRITAGGAGGVRIGARASLIAP